MEIECPNCRNLCQVNTEDLTPDTFYGENHECNYCGQIFEVGWHIDAELKSRALWKLTPPEEK